MNKKGILIIVLMMSIALLGLVGMQGYYINESYQLNSQVFDQSVMTAMNNVAIRVEKADATNFLKAKINPPQLPNFPVFEGSAQLNNDAALPQINNQLLPAESKLAEIITIQPYNGVKIVAYKDTSGTLKIQIACNVFGFEQAFTVKGFKDFLEKSVQQELIFENGRVFTQKTNPFRIAPNELDERIAVQKKQLQQIYDLKYKHNPKLPPILFYRAIENGQLIPIDPNDLKTMQRQQRQKAENPLVVNKNFGQELKSFFDSLKTFQEQVKVFQQLALEMQNSQRSLFDRIDPLMIDTLISLELSKQGISLPYHFEIKQIDNTINYVSVGKSAQWTESTPYKASLFSPEQNKNSGGYLVLNIAHKDRYLLRNMSVMMASSAALVLVILSCFAYTIYSVIRQKKLSQMKSDFINNMTHEFKTPVSTIMLASEALKDEQLAADRKLVSRYAGIIYDENLRLGTHVERVLNMAKLEKNDFTVEHNELSVNSLIQGVVDSMDLQLKNKKATMRTDLDAQNDIILGDELHLSNVIYNLVDNALKYSTHAPSINISTQNMNGSLFISVSDKGLGMSKEQRKKIFEKFYRAQTGNLHDIKGFGLGLSYVNSIVKLLGGNVNVQSELNKGSKFIIDFPLSSS